jgi:hypothetical protein
MKNRVIASEKAKRVCRAIPQVGHEGKNDKIGL